MAWIAPPRPAEASRVAIPGEALADAVEQALADASACRSAVGRAVGVRLAGDEKWLPGDLAICQASGATSYVRRSVKATAYACPLMADVSRAERMVYVLHEELHLAGVTDHHGHDGKDSEQHLNARIIAACFR
ncbi:MAG TPA: hypothetical protein VJU18_18970 [Vicinamibacteria bacterium]|nr:hypothetical protein [Vicinamibacteria bacterium]